MPKLFVRIAAAVFVCAAIASGGAWAAAPSKTSHAAGTVSTTSATPVFLTSVSFASAADGWAAGYAGSNGYIFRTTNSGSTWKRIHVGWDAQQMQFINRTDGWALVQSPAGCSTGQCQWAIVHTTNGGQTWSLQLNGHRCGQLRSLDFISASEGWVIESNDPCLSVNQKVNAKIMETINGGRSWSTSFRVAKALTSLHFGAPLNGWATADDQTNGSKPHCRTTVYARSSMSQTWSPQLHVSGYCYGGSVDFVSSRFGWVLVTNGGACAEMGCIDNRLYRTINGGNGWTIEKNRWTGGGCGFLLEPHFVTAAAGYIPVSKGAGNCTAGGIDITHDGGRHWLRKSPHGYQVADLSPVSASNVWAIGCSQTAEGCTHLVHTTDGGFHWSSMKVG